MGHPFYEIRGQSLLKVADASYTFIVLSIDVVNMFCHVWLFEPLVDLRVGVVRELIVALVLLVPDVDGLIRRHECIGGLPAKSLEETSSLGRCTYLSGEE